MVRNQAPLRLPPSTSKRGAENPTVNIPIAMRLVATLLFASALLCDAGEIAAGRWEGSIQTPGRELKVVVDLAQDKAGTWIGSVILPGLDVKSAARTSW